LGDFIGGFLLQKMVHKS